MLVVDANVVIAAISPGHVHHEHAQAILREAEAAVLHTLTMAEVLVGPARAGDIDRAARRLAAAGLRTVENEPTAAELASVRAATGPRMPDACALATAEGLSCPLATFDARLARAAAIRGVPVLGATPT